MDLPVLYEDNDLVAVNKPAGLITHSDGRTQEPTAEEWFKEKYPTASGGYVHRLDRDTSGVLIFARNAEAYEFLRKAFHDRAVQKTYIAVVYGALPEKKGTIDFDIGRSRKDFRLRSAQPKAKGRLREALTRYEVIDEADTLSLLAVHPETGRTHQIRVHLKAIHHPVVGDALYAPNQPKVEGVRRLALHAYEIEVPRKSGDTVTITAPLPDDLTPIVTRFQAARERFALSPRA